MIEYEEDWFLRLLLQSEGSVIPKAIIWTIPAVVLAVLLLYLDEWYPGMREDLGMLEASNSQLWGAVTGVIFFMMSFRTKQGFDRFWEGTGLLHQMRGEWFDTVSNCVTFSIAAKASKKDAVMQFRHAIIRIMSLCHGSALEEISGNGIQLESIDTFGLDDRTLNHLQECHIVYQFNKVEVMLHLLQSLITTALHDGVLQIPPPIASRVYQTISRGFVNLLNAKKIQDTKFPFPYVQLIAFLMVVSEILTPCMMTVIIHSKVLAVVFTFLPIFGLYCLNFVAGELENPFGTDDNDLPLQNFQTEMNNCLMMLLHPNTDLIATVSDRCEMDFHKLREQVCLSIEEVEDREKEEDEEELPEADRRPVRQKTRRLSEFDINNPASYEIGIVMSDDMRRSQSEMVKENLLKRAASEKAGMLDDPPLMTSQGSANSARSAPYETMSSMNSQSSMVVYPADDVYFGQAAVGPPIRARVSTTGDSDRSPTSSVGVSRISLDLENLSVHVGNEPQSDERQSPRMQEPRPMLNAAAAGNNRIPRADSDTSDAGLDGYSALSPSTPGSPSAPAAVAELQNALAVANGNHVNLANHLGDFEPDLSKSMDELMNSLEEWTRNVYREVDSLNSNSITLQKALKKFHEALPALKAGEKVTRRAG